MRSDHLDTGPIRKPQRNRETSWTEALPRMDPERLDTSAHVRPMDWGHDPLQHN
ncbi:hypothetical protein TWF703_008904 [Orbilia oligospora]|uniref:Uncharacterized protein n=1 Tax=Orbilia oligospora TaxID=2813651 RepID=A0A7C8JKW9_ORBOL|nr:hypothetical protein TWF703_008904 [Orbilia oligospora]